MDAASQSEILCGRTTRFVHYEEKGRRRENMSVREDMMRMKTTRMIRCI